MAATGPPATAPTELERVIELTMQAAPREVMIRRLSEALARTSRQIHALEDPVAPALQVEIATVRRTIDERERNEHLRLKRLRPRVHRWVEGRAVSEPLCRNQRPAY